ncbi:hypothetical protein [Emticicia sp. C21]|uniref:hypothetical protein n=1 Tax=Emticicia sp. C21 TaxID=2302915 RepID=UPI000E34DFE2|nr:hypothetical protein [Emticicia sp. C21]RFS17014.1 hypothetical protein D0T08_10070 [Emticicia sp. C21]
MNPEEINFFKTHLSEIRKYKKESDYELSNTLLVASNDFGIEHLDLILLAFDDESEDQSAIYSFRHSFADIYKKTDKETFFEVFLSNLSILFPHAIGWARTLFTQWTYNEPEGLLFVKIARRYPDTKEKILSVFDIILNERYDDGTESHDAANVKKYKEILLANS